MIETQNQAHCWNCQNTLSLLDFSRGDSCRKCGKDTRVCKNCKHYDPSAYNECHETQADRVVEKERSNFCDYFSPKLGRSNQGDSGPSPAEKARAAAEALFKKWG